MTQPATTPDLYALLELPSGASADDIERAFQRRLAQFAPEHVAGSAPEVQAFAAEQRALFGQAYAVLHDPDARQRYDHERGIAPIAETAIIEYRPLPPARGKERSPLRAEQNPPRRETQARQRGWLIPAVVGCVALALLIVLVTSSVRVADGVAALATPTIAGVTLPFAPGQIDQLRSRTATTPSAETWVALGDALFDNLQTLRENALQSPQYQAARNGWLDVADAYDQALGFGADERIASDRAIALYNYGNDTSDTERLEQAIAAAQAFDGSSSQQPRALLNYGTILIRTQQDAGVALLRRVAVVAPGSVEAQQAAALLQAYGQ